MAHNCPGCGRPWSRRVPLSHAPKTLELDESDLPRDAHGFDVCITENQLYVHLRR
mgnify:CR=1